MFSKTPAILLVGLAFLLFHGAMSQEAAANASETGAISAQVVPTNATKAAQTIEIEKVTEIANNDAPLVSKIDSRYVNLLYASGFQSSISLTFLVFSQIFENLIFTFSCSSLTSDSSATPVPTPAKDGKEEKVHNKEKEEHNPERQQYEDPWGHEGMKRPKGHHGHHHVAPNHYDNKRAENDYDERDNWERREDGHEKRSKGYGRGYTSDWKKDNYDRYHKIDHFDHPRQYGRSFNTADRGNNGNGWGSWKGNNGWKGGVRGAGWDDDEDYKIQTSRYEGPYGTGVYTVESIRGRDYGNNGVVYFEERIFRFKGYDHQRPKKNGHKKDHREHKKHQNQDFYYGEDDWGKDGGQKWNLLSWDEDNWGKNKGSTRAYGQGYEDNKWGGY